LLETYKEYDIYQDDDTGHYVVYDNTDPILSREVVRDTIGLFVKNGNPVNMNMLSYSTIKQTSQTDIDVDEIVSRGNIKSF